MATDQPQHPPTVSTRLSLEQYDQLRRHATAADRSVSWIVRQAILAHITAHAVDHQESATDA